MISPVIIKGNNLGIRLIISPEATFESILRDLEDKLHETKHYYKNIKPISLSFDGKKLTKEEKLRKIDMLNDKGINVKVNKAKPKLEKYEMINSPIDKDGLFIIGTIKNGQSIEAAKSIIIVGDIEQGASVISKGNIIVIGYIYGEAYVANTIGIESFIYSLDATGNLSRRN